MPENDPCKWSLAFSVLLHIALLAFLVFSFSEHNQYALPSQSVATPSVIQAVAVNEKQLAHQVIKPEIKHPVLEQEQILTKTPKVQELPKPKLLHSPLSPPSSKGGMKVSSLPKKTKNNILPPVKKEVDGEFIKKTTAKTLDETAKIESKTEKFIKKTPTTVVTKPSLSAKMKTTLEAELQKQLAEDEMQKAAAAQARYVNGEVDKYKALIVQAIGQNWLIPDNVRHNLSCELLIRVAPDGDVLSVEVLRSSGEAALDRSARAAVFKAAPLPVPKEAIVFDRFRELRLTVRPENIV